MVNELQRTQMHVESLLNARIRKMESEETQRGYR